MGGSHGNYVPHSKTHKTWTCSLVIEFPFHCSDPIRFNSFSLPEVSQGEDVGMRETGREGDEP